MTDHAKALADALRDIMEFYGMGEVDNPPDSLGGAAVAALAAYDAHPAEAATRENGDDALKAILADEWAKRSYKDDAQYKLSDADEVALNAMRRVSRALSTHQQLGADSELVKRLRDWTQKFVRGQTDSSFVHNASNAKLLNDAADAIERLERMWKGAEAHCADALSRAAQPDTVTVERIAPVIALALHDCGEWSQDAIADFVAKRVTAALAARSKSQ